MGQTGHGVGVHGLIGTRCLGSPNGFVDGLCCTSNAEIKMAAKGRCCSKFDLLGIIMTHLERQTKGLLPSTSSATATAPPTTAAAVASAAATIATAPATGSAVVALRGVGVAGWSAALELLLQGIV
jgi:hypothetical protein